MDKSLETGQIKILISLLFFLIFVQTSMEEEMAEESIEQKEKSSKTKSITVQQTQKNEGSGFSEYREEQIEPWWEAEPWN